jgi:hypothetical protein
MDYDVINWSKKNYVIFNWTTIKISHSFSIKFHHQFKNLQKLYGVATTRVLYKEIPRYIQIEVTHNVHATKFFLIVIFIIETFKLIAVKFINLLYSVALINDHINL